LAKLVVFIDFKTSTEAVTAQNNDPSMGLHIPEATQQELPIRILSSTAIPVLIKLINLENTAYIINLNEIKADYRTKPEERRVRFETWRACPNTGTGADTRCSVLVSESEGCKYDE